MTKNISFGTIFGIKNLINLWQNIPFRIQSKIITILPLLAILISTTFAILGNNQRSVIEGAAQRHIKMTSNLGEVLTLMVNVETGVRGYLLTKQDNFLKPFSTASQNLPHIMKKLSNLVESEPGLMPRNRKRYELAQIQLLIKKQMSALQEQTKYNNFSKNNISEQLMSSKDLMDKIRTQLNLIQTEEGNLLNERLRDINNIRKRDYIAAFFTLFIAIGTRFVLWHLFKTGSLQRINNLIENTQSINNGNDLIYQPSGKDDEIGNLEQEIFLISQQLIKKDQIENTVKYD